MAADRALARAAGSALRHRHLSFGPAPLERSIWPLRLNLAIDVTVVATLPLLSYHLVAQAVADRRRGRPAGLAVAALGAAGIVIGWYVMVPWVLDRVYEGRTVYAIEPVVYLALISLTVLATAMVVSAAAWLISRRQHPRELPAG